jgi:type IV secretory pathway VirB4 component
MTLTLIMRMVHMHQSNGKKARYSSHRSYYVPDEAWLLIRNPCFNNKCRLCLDSLRCILMNQFV